MLVLSDQTLQIVYLETAYQAQMQKILPSNQIVAKKLQHIFQLIKIQSIAHCILYGLHELPSRNTAEDRCLDKIFLSLSRYATNCAIPIYILIILDLSRNIKRCCCSKTGGELMCSGRVSSSRSTSGFVMLLLLQTRWCNFWPCLV
jgi:hypothetical protein